VMIVGMRMAVGLMDEVAGCFAPAVGEDDVHLGRAKAAAIDLLNVDPDL